LGNWRLGELLSEPLVTYVTARLFQFCSPKNYFVANIVASIQVIVIIRVHSPSATHLSEMLEGVWVFGKTPSSFFGRGINLWKYAQFTPMEAMSVQNNKNVVIKYQLNTTL
jgi:hypothetical protein